MIVPSYFPQDLLQELYVFEGLGEGGIFHPPWTIKRSIKRV